MPEVGQTYVTVRADTSKFGEEVGKGVKTGLDAASKAVENFEQETRSQMQRLTDTLNSAGRRMADVGKQMTMRVTLPIVGIGTAMFKAAGEFEASMNKVRAITGATGDQFVQMSEQAQELGRTTRFSAGEAADAMSFLGMAGFDATEIIGAMPGVLELAAAANLDIASSADIASNILSGYALETAQLGAVNDALVKTLTRTNTDLRQLGEAMKYAGPIANSAGVEFNQAAAAIGLMGNAGIQGSMAGTSLRQAISALISPTGTAQSAMEELGIVATDSAGRLLPLDEIIRQLEPHAENTGAMMEIFGARAGPAMAALVSQGADALVNLQTELDNSAGIAGEIAGIQMEGLNGAMLELRAAVEGLFIAFGESGLLQAFTGVIDKITGLVSGLANVNPLILKFVGVVAGIAAVVGPTALVVGKLTTAISSTIEAAAKAPSRITNFVTTMTRAQGVLAGVGAAIAVGTVAYQVYTGRKQEAEQATKDLAVALFLEGEAQRESLAQLAQNNDAVNRFLGAVSNLGLEISDVTQFVTDGTGKLAELVPAIEATKDAVNGTNPELAALAQEFLGVTTESDDLKYAYTELTREQVLAAAAVRDFAPEVRRLQEAERDRADATSLVESVTGKMAEATEDATDVVGGMTDALDEQTQAAQEAEEALWDLFDVTVQSFRAGLDFEDQVWETVAAVEAYERALRDGTAQGNDLAESQDALLDQILGTADSAVRAAQGLASLNGEQLDATQATAIYIAELQRFAQTLSPSDPVRRNLDALIDVLQNQIPQSVTVTVDADVTPALSALSSLTSSDIYSPWDIGQVFGPGGELNAAALTAGDTIGTDYVQSIGRGVSGGSSSVVNAAEVLIEDLDDAASRAAATFADALQGVLDTAKDAYDEAWSLVEGRRSQEAAAQRVADAEDALAGAQEDVRTQTRRVQQAAQDLASVRLNAEASASDLRNAEQELADAQRDLSRANQAVTDATDRLQDANYRLLQVSEDLLDQGPESIANYIAIATAAGLEEDEIQRLVDSYHELRDARNAAAQALEYQMAVEQEAARLRAGEQIQTAVEALQQKVFYDIEQAVGTDTSQAEREAASLVISAAEAYADAAANRGTSAWNTVFRDSVGYFRNAYPFLTDELAGISAAIGLANGRIVRSSMFAQIGEAGPEAVIPLTRPQRALDLMDQSGLTTLAQRQGGSDGPLVQMNGVVIQDATDADLVAQRVNAAYRARILVG